MIVSTTSNLSYLGSGFVVNSTLTHMVENGCFFFVCITREISVHAAVGEVTSDSMGVAAADGLSILIISFIETLLLGVYLGFRRFGISTLFLMLNFCAVDSSISLSTLDLRSLYSEALFTGFSCTARMFANFLLLCYKFFDHL